MASLGQVYVTIAVTVCVVVLLLSGKTQAQDARDLALGIAAVNPPQRPEQFRNIDELNKYLAELRQYYTILGRPR